MFLPIDYIPIYLRINRFSNNLPIYRSFQGNLLRFDFPWRIGNLQEIWISSISLFSSLALGSSINDVMLIWTLFDPLLFPLTLFSTVVSQSLTPPSLSDRDVIYGWPLSSNCSKTFQSFLSWFKSVCYVLLMQEFHQRIISLKNYNVCTGCKTY